MLYSLEDVDCRAMFIRRTQAHLNTRQRRAASVLEAFIALAEDTALL